MFPDFSQLDALGKQLTEFMTTVTKNQSLILNNLEKIDKRIQDCESAVIELSEKNFYKEVNHV